MKTLKNQIVFVFSLLFCINSAWGQNPDYADVAVIVNDNDSTSIAIGDYYAQVRGISVNRILHVQVPVAEETDSLGFEDLRAQIEAELMMGGLLDTVNYLVTTKGMPLRVSKHGGCDSALAHHGNGSFIGQCTAVESELPLILGAYSNEILQDQYGTNPYQGENAPFDRDLFEMFFVSRLDGNNLADVKQLIDRGGPDNTYYAPQSNFLIDAYGIDPNLNSVFNTSIVPSIIGNINDLGLTIVDDLSATTLLVNQTDLVGYANFLSDTVALATNSYQPGALVFAGMSYSCYSFDAGGSPVATNIGGRLIASGAPAIAGSVSNMYLGPSTSSPQLFDYYLDSTTTTPTNIATAFFRATPRVSGQTILIGDPKTALGRTGTASTEGPFNTAAVNLQLFPNPNNGTFQIKGTWKSQGQSEIKIYATTGQLIFERNETSHLGEFQYDFDLEGLPSGIYYLNVTQGNTSESKKFVLISK